MVLTSEQERKLILRLRRLSILLLVFSASFFSYSFLAPESLSSEEGLVTAEAGYLPSPGPILYVIGSVVFAIAGLSTLLFAIYKYKNISE